MTDYACRRVTLFTKNDQVVNQANQHAIRPSLILRFFTGDRQWLEMYGSLFAIKGKMEIGTHCRGLHVVEEFPDVFLENLLGLPPNKEIKFCINLVPGAQHVSITPYRMT